MWEEGARLAAESFRVPAPALFIGAVTCRLEQSDRIGLHGDGGLLTTAQYGAHLNPQRLLLRDPPPVIEGTDSRIG